MTDRDRRPVKAPTVVTHNVWVGQPLDELRDNLTRLAKATGRPLALLLQEAKRGGHWTIPGYVSHAAAERGNDDADNNRILVRDDAEILDRGSVKVPGDGWEYDGNPKPMKTFPWVAVRRGRVYVLVGVHRAPIGPRPPKKVNREAWNAEHRTLVRLVDQLLERWPAAVVVLGGDWNAEWDEQPGYEFSLRSLAEEIGATARVLHIDGFLVVNGRAERAEKLDDRFGSDAHRPVKGVVKADLKAHLVNPTQHRRN